MPSRYIILTGAPLVEHLDWAEACLTPAKIANDATWLTSSSTASGNADTSAHSGARWRAVAMSEATPKEQRDSNDEHFGFANEAELYANESLMCRILHAPEQSVTFLEEVETSALSPMKLTSLDESFADDDLDQSFLSALTNSGSMDEVTNTTTAGIAPRDLIGTAFTDLRRLPDHSYLSRISPQTVTVDLLVAVITILPTKTIQLRRRKAQMDIAEIVVGDETRAGFGINVWLTPASDRPCNRPDGLRHSTQSLRPGDLLMVRNLALSTFQNVVSGQTLSRRLAQNNTTLTKISKAAAASITDPSQKLRRVYEWSLRFLSSQNVDQGRTKEQRAKQARILPPDSQSQ